MDRNQFPRFTTQLRRQGAAGVNSREFDLGNDGNYRLQYIPFEHVNQDAMLVIVGITPGPTQLALAYGTAQQLLQTGRLENEILLGIKKAGAFGGPSMKPNLLKMLRHFQFEKLLGIDDVESLWEKNASLLHSTSVVPHAAFTTGKTKEKMFAGSFDEIMGSHLLRECFEDCFIPSVREINPKALFVGLGPCPEAALRWCVEQGYLHREQVLGSFCHPSGSGGSMTKYYLRGVSRADLDPKDPIRSRCDWLDRAYEQMRASTSSRGAGPVRRVLPAPAVTKPGTEIKKISKPTMSNLKPPVAAVADSIGTIFRELRMAGYKPTNETSKLGEFVSPGSQTIYVVKTTSRLNRINVMVHPSLEAGFLNKLDGVESVSSGHRFHSNMTRFPKRLHKGETETAYGWQITIGTLADLSRFLAAFRGVSF